ncbi:MAG: hypothetical protein NTW59_03315 [Candidatus Diapherotrites archaeon]|nr:hypothetical protein [Candidatus Diapherotrites archaeon]
MFKLIPIIAVFGLLLFGSVAALSVDAPSNVFLYGQEKEILVKITNEGSSPADFSVKFLGPVTAVITPKNSEVQPKTTTAVIVSIPADGKLAGETYKSTIIVESNGNKTYNEITLHFKAGQEAPAPEPAAPGFDFGTAASGFFALFGTSALAGIFTFENMLNALLIIVAAILLIAFIARFVKRLEAKK